MKTTAGNMESKEVEANMSTHNPIGSCCARPRFNEVGGVDNHARPGRPPAFAIVGILAALAIAYACTLVPHSN